MNINWINANLKIVIPAVLVGLIILGGGGYFVYQTSKKAAPTGDTAPQDVKQLTAEVSKVFDLPPGEEPTIATITDVEKLKSEPFFQKAKNGDKVLIYANAQKIILYDPNTKRVLDVAPFNPGTPSAQVASPQPSPSP